MRKACYLIPIMALTLFSCSSQENSSISNSNTSDSTNDYSTNTIEVAKSLDLIQVEGRLEVLSDGIAIDYSGSAITFKADCKGTVSASITSDITNYDESKNGERGLTLFSIFVDGERTLINQAVTKETRELVLTTNLEEGIHTISLVRQTNVYMSIATIHSLTLSGKLLSSSKKKAFIEYIGDSYTTGYSLQGAKEEGGYDSAYDDPIDAYAYHSASILDADYSLTAFSGAGFAYGYTPFTVKEVYPYLNYFRSKEEYYSPERSADLIVINLGTNDVSQVGFNNYHTQIEKGITDLVEEAFSSYGDKNIPLIFCTDATHENNDSLITEAMKNNPPDVPYELVCLTTNNQKYNGHPDKECGNKQGEELAKAIKEYLPDLFN